VVDSILAGHHGLNTLAAVTVGSSIWTVALLLCVGVLMAIPPSVVATQWRRPPPRDRSVVAAGGWIALGMGLLLTVLVWHSPILLDWIRHRRRGSPGGRCVPARDRRWRARAVAVLLFPLSERRAGMDSADDVVRHRRTVAADSARLRADVRLGADPELGAAGLGYATALVLWLQALGFLVYLRRSARFDDLELFAASIRRTGR